MTTQEALEIVSYKLGLKQGEEALKDTVLLTEVVQQAISDKTAGSPKAIDLRQYMQATKLVKTERLRLDKVAGEAFLQDNQNSEDIQSTTSGLQYRVLEQGNGTIPNRDNSVTVHYEGRLIDDTVFDSSIARDKPATFLVKKVIAGWQEGLQLMPVGSRYELFIPQNLAYGERGTENGVPPFATLHFIVSLLSIES